MKRLWEQRHPHAHALPRCTSAPAWSKQDRQLRRPAHLYTTAIHMKAMHMSAPQGTRMPSHHRAGNSFSSTC